MSQKTRHFIRSHLSYKTTTSSMITVVKSLLSFSKDIYEVIL